MIVSNYTRILCTTPLAVLDIHVLTQIIKIEANLIEKRVFQIISPL